MTLLMGIKTVSLNGCSHKAQGCCDHECGQKDPMNLSKFRSPTAPKKSNHVKSNYVDIQHDSSNVEGRGCRLYLDPLCMTGPQSLLGLTKHP